MHIWAKIAPNVATMKYGSRDIKDKLENNLKDEIVADVKTPGLWHPKPDRDSPTWISSNTLATEVTPLPQSHQPSVHTMHIYIIFDTNYHNQTN